MKEEIKFSVFTKPWKNISLEKLADLVGEMGFDAVEYPFREGYQIQPSDGAKGILELCRVFRTHGIDVTSIAGGVDVRVIEGTSQVVGINDDLFAACSDAGIRIIRICQGLEKNLGFQKNIENIQRKYTVIQRLCEKYGITLGVQMHNGLNISNAAETYILLKDFDPRHIAAVWDSGHSGLAGNEPEIALDMLWHHLCMVNFKAAYYHRLNGPEAAEAEWSAYWTTGRHACGSWKRAVDYLKLRDYQGVICLPAEYSDESHVEEYTREDLQYIKQLF